MAIVPYFSSCVSNEIADSDKVSQEEIYQTYRVTANRSDESLTAFASFRFGGSSGTTLRLTAGSNVLWNAQEMPADQNMFMGAFYEKKEKLELQNKHVFVFTDTEKKSYTNEIELMPAEPIDIPTEFSSKKSLTITWVGQALREGESITCNLKDSTFTTSVRLDLMGANSITVKPEDWAKSKKGLINISLERTYKLSLPDATHLGGSIEASYISKSYPILIN